VQVLWHPMAQEVTGGNLLLDLWSISPAA